MFVTYWKPLSFLNLRILINSALFHVVSQGNMAFSITARFLHETKCQLQLSMSLVIQDDATIWHLKTVFFMLSIAAVTLGRLIQQFHTTPHPIVRW